VAASGSTIWRLELRANPFLTAAVAGACPTASAGPAWSLAKLRANPPLPAAVAASGRTIWRLELRANPPSLTQWQASVSQSVPAQYGLGGSNSGLNPSQSQWQAPPSFDSQPHFSLPNTHNSESPISSFQANITENLNRVKSIRTSHKRDSQRFTAFGDTKCARPTGTRVASNIEPLVILPGVIKNLKELAHKDMVRRVFEIGLFPMPDEMTVTANAALDTVIGSDGNYFLPTPCCMTYQRRNSKP